MFPQKYKIISTIISIVLFIAAVSIFIIGLARIENDIVFLKAITPYGFLLLSIGLLLAWQGIGHPGGLAFFILSLPLIMFVSLALRSSVYNLQIIIMAGIAVPSFIFYKTNYIVLLEKKEEFEKIQEERNLLENRLKKDNELTQAFSKKLDRYNKLKDLGELFNAKLSLEDIYQLTIDRACEITEKTNAAKLFLAKEDSHDLILCSWNSDEKKLKPGFKRIDTFDKWVFNKLQPLHITNLSRDFRFDYQEGSDKIKFNSLIIVPLVIQRRTIGLLRLSSPQTEAYTADDLRLLDFISDLASAAINNGRLYIKTQELAIRDSLTGLYVHRYFSQRLTEEFSRCKKDDKPLFVIMLDIDHFKDYNDKYGHAAGDKVLKGVADIMQDNMREANVLTRYGGEEFVAFFPGIEKKQAMEIAASIRTDIETAPFVLRQQETKITASLGVASFPKDAKTEEDLLKGVDFLLYKAKKEGRNKVCIN